MAKMKKVNLDYVKASRRGSREAEIEVSTGFISKHKVHKSKKSYCRKSKHLGRD
jgi:hypothetical protein